jgi:hypothetical protein
MKKRMTIAALTATAALVAAGGTALASGGPGPGSDQDRAARCQQMAERIAKRQGVTVAELEAKLKERALARVAAALETKRITEEQARTLRSRIGAWKLCSGTAAKAAAEAWQAKRFHLFALSSMVRSGYAYLDLSREKLRQELRSGRSLGESADDQPGKSAAGLKTAMLAKITERLAKAVGADTLTDARRDALLERYGALADRLIAKKKPKQS